LAFQEEAREIISNAKAEAQKLKEGALKKVKDKALEEIEAKKS